MPAEKVNSRTNRPGKASGLSRLPGSVSASSASTYCSSPLRCSSEISGASGLSILDTWQGVFESGLQRQEKGGDGVRGMKGDLVVRLVNLVEAVALVGMIVV